MRGKGTTPSLLTLFHGNPLREVFGASNGAQVQGLPELQVQEPHLEESVDVAGGAQVGETHEGALEKGSI